MRTLRRESEEAFFDPLLPVQWLDSLRPHAARTPEQRLLLAVLADAIVQLNRGGVAREAEEQWIRAADSASPFAFASICDALGIDADYLARTLLTSPRIPLRAGVLRRRVFRLHIRSRRSRSSDRTSLAPS